MIAHASAMLFLDSIGCSPARDVIFVVRMLQIVFACARRHFCCTYAADCVLNSVYAQPLQKTDTRRHVSLTLNSTDLAIICAGADVNLITS